MLENKSHSVGMYNTFISIHQRQEKSQICNNALQPDSRIKQNIQTSNRNPIWFCLRLLELGRKPNT